MLSKYYGAYVLGTTQVSVQPQVPNLTKVSNVTSASFQIFPDNTENSSLALSATLTAFFSGRVPTYIKKFNKRYKTTAIAGAKVQVNGKDSVELLFRFRSLMFYYVPDFRGVKQPQYNQSIAMVVCGFDYIIGMGDPMFLGQFGADPAALNSYITLNIKQKEAVTLIPRFFSYPALQES